MLLKNLHLWLEDVIICCIHEYDYFLCSLYFCFLYFCVHYWHQLSDQSRNAIITNVVNFVLWYFCFELWQNLALVENPSYHHKFRWFSYYLHCLVKGYFVSFFVCKVCKKLRHDIVGTFFKQPITLGVKEHCRKWLEWIQIITTTYLWPYKILKAVLLSKQT